MAKLVLLLIFRKATCIFYKLAWQNSFFVWSIIKYNTNISDESDAREQGS